MQAEATVVAAAVGSRDSHATVATRLGPDDLGHRPHQLLFQAALEAAADDGYGPVAVTEHLLKEGRNRLEEVGGHPDVVKLGSRGRAVTTSDLEHRIGMVLQASGRRRLDAAGQDITALARDTSVDADTLIGRALDRLVDAHRGDDTSGIATVDDLSEDVRKAWVEGVPPQGVETGWKTLDRVYRPRKGRWTLVNGIPGHGKSTWLDALAVNLSKAHGWRFAICSPEKVPVADHLSDLVTAWSGQPFYDGVHPRIQQHELDDTLEEVRDRFVWAMPSESSRSVAGVLAAVELAHRRQSIDGLIIDPWNELDHSRPSNMSETEHISEQLTRIRLFARRHDVHVWLVAHPTKLSKGMDGKYPVPTPYDVSGSAHWRNKADNALTVWRDHAQPGTPTQIHVQKIRFQPQEGTEGRADLTFVPWQKRFRDDV